MTAVNCISLTASLHYNVITAPPPHPYTETEPKSAEVSEREVGVSIVFLGPSHHEDSTLLLNFNVKFCAFWRILAG